MSKVAGWALSFAIALAALVGLIALINSRDASGVDQHPAVAEGPGAAYKGQPALSRALQDALERGNVVVLYRDEKPPAGTQALVPPGGRALEQAGQSVVLDREPTLDAPLAALSATKIQTAASPQQLRAFVDYWLGGG